MPGPKEWLIKALSDLKMAKKGIKDDDDTLDGAAYHTHQCAEKALKAFLFFSKQPIKKVHDLELLVELCSAIDQNFKVLFDSVERLNPYAIYSRYPDDRFYIDRQEVEEAIEMAATVLNFVKKKIEEPQNPTLKLFDR